MDGFALFFWTVCLVVLLIFVGVAVMAPPDTRIAKCNELGGVWVDRMEGYGKQQHRVTVGCIKRDAFIQLN